MILGKNRFEKNDCLKKVKQKLNKQMFEMLVLCRVYLYSQKKIVMFTTELYQKLKNRLAALRRSL